MNKKYWKEKSKQASIGFVKGVSKSLKETMAKEASEGLRLRSRIPSARSFTTLDRRARSPSRSVLTLNKAT